MSNDVNDILCDKDDNTTLNDIVGCSTKENTTRVHKLVGGQKNHPCNKCNVLSVTTSAIYTPIYKRESVLICNGDTK